MTYDDVAARLSPEARELLLGMVDLHLSASNHRRFEYISTLDGRTRLLFAHGGELECDESTIRDLQGVNLVRNIGINQHDLPHQAILFAQWLRAQPGPVDTVETEVHRLLDGSAFGKANPAAVHHLSEAQALLWSDTTTNDETVVEIGGHLRSAIQIVAVGIVGGNPEKALDAVATTFARIAAAREATAMDEWVRTTYRLVQRLTHIREEAAEGRPLRSQDELRRTVFLATVVCAEMAALADTTSQTT